MMVDLFEAKRSMIGQQFVNTARDIAVSAARAMAGWRMSRCSPYREMTSHSSLGRKWTLSSRAMTTKEVRTLKAGDKVEWPEGARLRSRRRNGGVERVREPCDQVG